MKCPDKCTFNASFVIGDFPTKDYSLLNTVSSESPTLASYWCVQIKICGQEKKCLLLISFISYLAEEAEYTVMLSNIFVMIHGCHSSPLCLLIFGWQLKYTQTAILNSSKINAVLFLDAVAINSRWFSTPQAIASNIQYT